jgi:hypothetical protein
MSSSLWRGVRCPAFFVFAAVVMAAFSPARGQSDPVSDGFFAFPDDAVAWWALDPRPFATGDGGNLKREVIEGAMRAAVSSGLLADDDAAEMLAGFLVASVAGSEPHRLCVLRFEAEPESDEAMRSGDGGGMRITDLGVVLEVRTDSDHQRLLRTVKSVVVDHNRTRDPEGVATGVQSPLELPGGVEGIVYREADWPEWREVAWVSLPGRFIVALGRDTLAAWLDASMTEEGPSSRHHSIVDRTRPPGRRVFGMFADIDAVRNGFPEAFAFGRVSRILEEFQLSNARQFMMHARLLATPPGATSPPLLALDATWSPRSRPEGEIGLRQLSASIWPSSDLRGGTLDMPPPGGTFAVVLREDLNRWISSMIGAYKARLKPWDQLTFNAEQSVWVERYGGALLRVFDAIDDWIVLTDDPPPPVAIPGVMTVYMELKPGTNIQAFMSDFMQVMSSLSKQVVYSVPDRTWSLRLVSEEADPEGVLKVFAWGLAGPIDERVLVLGWSVDAINTARARMGDIGMKKQEED